MSKKIIALLAYRNERKYLPGFFKHVLPFVDNIICLDDHSRDASQQLIPKDDKIIQLPRPPVAFNFKEHYAEAGNRRKLLNAALEHGATHVLCCDADERFETNFLEDMHINVTMEPDSIFWLNSRDLWNSPDQYRVDGIWSTKRRPILFPIKPFNLYHKNGLLHRTWIPPEQDDKTLYEYTDYNIYHLRSINPFERANRVAKFKRIDGEGNNDGRGYDYLNSEEGMLLENVPPTQEYDRSSLP